MVGGDLADVDDLVPAESQRGADEDELGEGEEAGHQGDRAGAAHPAGPARSGRLFASPLAYEEGAAALGHRPPLLSDRLPDRLSDRHVNRNIRKSENVDNLTR
ncbi:hypothetical protein GCM10009601_08730 [Streptomyces thermospinosisporus]|uniref:Uncharacterized protein n=1 Tax=Streptomyces thermospinosisporus TaxID=161482 RepID=A0ABN1YQ48_9ACTN